MPRPKSYSVTQSSIESIEDSDDGLTQADPWAAAAAAVARPRDGASSSTRRGRPLRSATQESIESIDSVDTPLDALAVGDDVEADRRGRGFRPGAVAAAHADRTYCVAYDDGDVEDRAPSPPGETCPTTAAPRTTTESMRRSARARSSSPSGRGRPPRSSLPL